MIMLSKDRHFYAIWFLGFPSCDMFAALFKKDGDELSTFTLRFRWHVPTDEPDVFLHHDRKSWHTMTTAEDPDEAVCKIDSVLDKISAQNPSGPCEIRTRIDVNGDGEQASALLMAQPWAHTKVESITLEDLPLDPDSVTEV